VQQPDDRAVLLATVSGWLQLAALSPPGQATTLAQRALDACDSPASGREDPRLRALQVEALLRTGARARAEPLAQRLWRDGYRDAAFHALLKSHALAPAVDAPAEVAASNPP
jgi:hypothetical protein